MTKYRSKFEKTVVTGLQKKKIKYKYEEYIVKFTQPAINRTYLPDLYFPKTDLWIQEQTDYDIRFCFMNANNKIRKGSKTSYINWCEANNFLWSEKEIPLDWMT